MQATLKVLGRLALLWLIPLPVLSMAAARSQDPPQRPPNQTFDLGALMARLAAVPERRARFEEEKRLAVLSEPQRMSGRLFYRRPDRLERITDGPDSEKVVVNGDRLVLTERQEPPRVVDLNEQPELRALVDAVRGPLSGDLGALQRSFDVTASGTPADWRLLLRPTDQGTAKLLSTVEVSGKGDAPREVVVTQADGDEDRLLIEPLP